jgi:hypothetical protein
MHVVPATRIDQQQRCGFPKGNPSQYKKNDVL